MKNYMKNLIKNNNAGKISIVFLLTITVLWANPQARSSLGRQNLLFLPGQVIVKYRNYVSQNAALSSAQNIGGFAAHLLQHIPEDQGPMAVAYLRGKSVEEAMNEFNSNPDVEFAQPNYIYHLNAVPNDTNYAAKLWGLNNSGQTIAPSSYTGTTPHNPGTSGKDINAQTAWNTITDCSSVTVAVIDSGINYNQEDLSANIISGGGYSCPGATTGSHGCDFVGVGDNDPMDLNGHGTHVAGTIGAVGNNNLGSTGICWTAKILAVRAADASGVLNSADIVEAVNFAIGTGAGQGNAKVINMSFGTSVFDSAFNTALTTAQTNDVVVVASAGNSNQNHNITASYPCDYAQTNIICVAAVDQSYAKADFSDFDSNATAANRKVDIAAPGTNIFSTWTGSNTTITDNFTTGWTTSPASASDRGWGQTNCNVPPYGVLSIMQTPGTNWCIGGTPANSIDNTVYKAFDLSTYNSASLTIFAWVDLAQSTDFFQVNMKGAGGTPFTSGTSLLLQGGSFHTGDFVHVSLDLTNCLTSTCSVGFRYLTDSSANGSFDGVALTAFSINGLTLTTNAYNTIDGTSMASPHVAGIATMLRARNPNFTSADVVTAILAGGDVETGASNTKTGMVADAFGSLKFIPDTTGPGVGGALTVSSP